MNWKFWKQTKDYPPFWQDYLQRLHPPWPAKTPIEALDFVVFDTETSGLNANNDKLLTIGALRLHQQKIRLADQYEVRVLRAENYRTDAVPIHGIVPNKQLGIPQARAAREFVHFLGNSILVGHNIGFDVSMINQALAPLVDDQLRNPVLDTARLAIRVEHTRPTHLLNPSAYTLDALCDRYNIAMHDRHTASGDALLTAYLLMRLLSRLKKRGVKTWGDLKR
ncbi:MAG: 3'-5' exonuclease [Bacteroidota bacterium]